MHSILFVALLLSSVAFAQKEEPGIAISQDGEVSFSGRAGKYLAEHLPRIEPDEKCKQNRRCASVGRFGDQNIECEVSGRGGTLSTYTCRVKAFSEALSEKLFKQMDMKDQTVVGDKITRRLGHLVCESNKPSYSCYIRPLDGESVNSCFIISRKSREADPPAKICVYNSNAELDFGIETSRGEIGGGRHSLFQQTCDGSEGSKSMECPKKKPSSTSGATSAPAGRVR